MPKIRIKPGWQKIKGTTRYEKITKRPKRDSSRVKT